MSSFLRNPVRDLLVYNLKKPNTRSFRPRGNFLHSTEQEFAHNTVMHVSLSYVRILG